MVDVVEVAAKERHGHGKLVRASAATQDKEATKKLLHPIPASQGSTRKGSNHQTPQKLTLTLTHTLTLTLTLPPDTWHARIHAIINPHRPHSFCYISE